MGTIALVLLLCLSAIAALAGIAVLIDMYQSHHAKTA